MDSMKIKKAMVKKKLKNKYSLESKTDSSETETIKNLKEHYDEADKGGVTKKGMDALMKAKASDSEYRKDLSSENKIREYVGADSRENIVSDYNKNRKKKKD